MKTISYLFFTLVIFLQACGGKEEDHIQLSTNKYSYYYSLHPLYTKDASITKFDVTLDIIERNWNTNELLVTLKNATVGKKYNIALINYDSTGNSSLATTHVLDFNPIIAINTTEITSKNITEQFDTLLYKYKAYLCVSEYDTLNTFVDSLLLTKGKFGTF